MNMKVIVKLTIGCGEYHRLIFKMLTSIWIWLFDL